MNLEIAARSELRDFVVKLLARVDALELHLANANKNSSNPSKSPSSDITNAGKGKKKNKPGRPRKRKAGGQPGHERKLREALPPERVDEIIEYEITFRDLLRLAGRSASDSN